MVDKSSVVPIYHQLKTLIQNRIISGEYPVGSLLPSEREMCQTYSISRMTVRQAIIDLVNEGLLKRERGRGTYVARPKIEQGLSLLTSFTEDMKRRDMLPGTKLISLEAAPAAGRIAVRLNVPEGELVHEITRLRLADGEPMALETSHIPLAYVPKLAADALEHGSLYESLRKQGIQMAFAEQTLEAATAKGDEVKLLHMKAKAPVLLIERTTYMPDGRPVEYVKSVYRGDRYKFSIRLTSQET